MQTTTDSDTPASAPAVALPRPCSPLVAIAERLRTQDNRCTADPMFCVQILVADVGYDASYSDSYCWYSGEQTEVVFDVPENLDGWEKFGYKERWETVMVAFTERGCEEYLALNGHNDRRRAHKGKVRIYAESFRRCPEMLAIREVLMAVDSATEANGKLIDDAP
jgi:hypothetical protein